MASHNDDKQGDTKDLSPAPNEVSQSGPDDITEELQSDTMNPTVKPQKPGRFKRTALTFFGVRKSICILPNFFGGRSKSQNKCSSKKGITKSRTHDGISKVIHDDNLRSGYTTARDFEFHSQRDSVGELHSSCQDECSHPTADQKSQAFTRQKRGLRGLFHSLKYHRNHKNVGLDKPEMIAMTPPQFIKEVPAIQDNTHQLVTECLVSEPDVPDFANVISDISMGSECIDVIALEKHVKQDRPKSELDDHTCSDQIEDMKLASSTDHEESFQRHSEPCPELQVTFEPALKSETPAGSTDQLNFMFGDVASLKSFDSLTGCGDIIADQEDDSITDSTVSGERSRNGGKRASCYLTYQGGGEEMASPEDLGEECLQDFWGNNESDEMCHTCNQDHSDLTADLTCSLNMGLQNSSSAQQASDMDTSSIVDILTPQSEHQESVPNSDEGYYDSTTPGPEDGQEKSVRQTADRLPRDSYSGDALYELFAPDESLISPHYENKSKLPGSNPCDYLSDKDDMTDSAFVPDMNRLQISAELYKVHNFLERPSTCSKSPELDQNVSGHQEVGTNKNCNLNLKSQVSVNRDNTDPDGFEVKENEPAATEKRLKSLNVDHEKPHRTLSFGNTSDPDFEIFCEPKEQHLEENKPVALPYRNINSQSTDCGSDLDDGQVCFSQALVDYTKHSQMLSNLQNNVNDLETNSAFTPNMQALPTIVTFDVVDMHNEGEYDQHIHMELEEDISSPFQEFEESYLQKDAFAECDYQVLDLYEQNLISNTWAVASLPRHLGLTRVTPSMSNSLSPDRRSRSLDTEGLELKMPDTYRENRAAIISSSQGEKNSGRDLSSYYKKNVLASEVRDDSGSMALSWQTRSEMALSLSLADDEITEKLQGLSQTQVKHKTFSISPGSDFSNSKSQHPSCNVSDRVSRDVVPRNTEHCKRQRNLPLQSDPCSPHSTFVFPGMTEQVSDDIDEDIFCKDFTSLQLYNQRSKSRPAGPGDGKAHSASPVQVDVSKEDMAICSKTRTSRDVASCNKKSDTTFD
ncbi:APC membrane recruitment protein 1 [Antennarius striatus]|uniref:APC membrane recruitment protein 1 n=1 Tax=Antennarius striatus TaxID=241820 RepID=UPI0035B24431